jgi:mevalonate kinase
MNFYGNGKLLLTAEYVVLDGAQALALPTQYGQSLRFEADNTSDFLTWKSFDVRNQLWFEGRFTAQPPFQILENADLQVAQMLQKTLNAAYVLSPNHAPLQGRFETHLSFERAWGLGTSSTLIYTLSRFFDIDPYVLLAQTFGGSGYDIAAAAHHTPFLFSNKSGKTEAEKVDFSPVFAENLYFVYLGKKQNSREGIRRYREVAPNLNVQFFEQFNLLTAEILTAQRLSDFNALLLEHENLIAQLVRLTRAKTLYFPDFWGEVKSLGAWGGDFVLATSARSEAETRLYFQQKGFETVVNYQKMVI